MKVLILCGGIGSRLREETQFKPKALVEVGGKALIRHIMEHFINYGYNEFVLALGYKGNEIKKYFDKKEPGLKVTLVDTGLQTKTAERVLLCEKYIPQTDSDFWVCYSDGLSDVNLGDFYNFHNKSGLSGTLLGAHPRSKYGRIYVDSHGLVEKVEEKPLLSDWTNAGYMIYKREAFSYFKKDEMDFVSLDRMAKDRQLSLFKHDGFWYAVDTFKELEDLNLMYQRNKGLWTK